MKNFKNILVGLVTLSSFASAQIVSDVHVGVSNAKVLDESYTEFNGGYGFNKYFDSNIVVGTSINFAFNAGIMMTPFILIICGYYFFKHNEINLYLAIIFS